jgi:hypothetical protein
MYLISTNSVQNETQMASLKCILITILMSLAIFHYFGKHRGEWYDRSTEAFMNVL